MITALLAVLLALFVYRACLTVMFYPVAFWDLRKW
jgi:hypothetical protein